MAEYTIDKIEYGGNTYKLQDNVSGYTTNTGTLTSAVTSLTTTAGAHTTISNKTGATSIAIPTKTSHLTNDSGYITSYTDKKLEITNINLDNIIVENYYPIIGKGDTAAIRQYDSNGLVYNITSSGNNGQGRTQGVATLFIGNAKVSGSSNGNARGRLCLYGTSIYYIQLQGDPTADRTITLPDKDGTIALTSDIPTTLPASDVYAWAKAATKPTYTASEVGAVPTSRTVNGKALSSNITLTANDIATVIGDESGELAGDINYLFGHVTSVTDYITEQGIKTGASSGAFSDSTVNWRYRKWSSGRVEAWGVASGSCAINTSDGGGYRTAWLTTSIPSGIFSSTPYVWCSEHNGSTSAAIGSIIGGSGASTTSTGSWAIYRYSSSSTSQTRVFCFYCVQL